MSLISEHDTKFAPVTSTVKTLSLSSLSLNFFRNYASARLEVSPAPVVLTGLNGAGKTNILEAISLLTPGRGLRRAKLAELDAIKPSPLEGEGWMGGNAASNEQAENTPHLNPPPQWGRNYEQPWTIAARVNGRSGEAMIGTGRDSESLDETDKRVVKIDGKMSKSQAELSKHLSIIWLTPQMEQLFQEGTSAGRKFLDRLVFSFDADHASRINEYDYAMRERNKLLQYGRADAHWLDTLENTMAGCASAIAGARISTVEHLNHTILASPLSFPKAHVDVEGFAEAILKTGAPAIEAENALKIALENGRNADAAAGRTLTGIHRSELRVTHIQKAMAAQACSTGEQKAMMLSIVLAQARAGAQWHGVVPVVLLDEVPGHLDATKRFELFEEICQIGAQTWMTGTDALFFAGLEERAQFFQVDNGVINCNRI